MSEVILLHGWGCDGSIWHGLRDHLERAGHSVTSVDFPGFGSEPEPPVPWGVEEYTVWLEGFLRERKIEKPVLVGHSFGGRVSLVYGSRNPVEKIILVDAAGVRPKRGVTYYVKVWSFKAAKRLARLVYGRERANKFIERRRAKAGSADYNAASPVMRGTLSRVVNDDLRRFMPLIGAPTLLVWGELDTATPVRDAKIMERLIPDAGLVVFAGAGHYSFLDRPAQFAAVVDSFLGS